MFQLTLNRLADDMMTNTLQDDIHNYESHARRPLGTLINQELWISWIGARSNR
jgi:hypothetical protein